MAFRHARRDSLFRPAAESLEDRLALAASPTSYIAAVYQDVLDRAVLPQELSYWTQQIQGGRPAIDLATQLVQSPEHRADQINQDYQRLLGRTPSASEMAYYQNAFASGENPDQVLLSFLTSPEYEALHPGPVNYIDALYNDVLGRDADAAGQTYYLDELAQGDSAETVVMGFLTSPEREGQLVDQVYADVLRRADTPVEHQYQVDLLIFGGSNPDDLLIGALGSPEFLKNHGGTTS